MYMAAWQQRLRRVARGAMARFCFMAENVAPAEHQARDGMYRARKLKPVASWRLASEIAAGYVTQKSNSAPTRDAARAEASPASRLHKHLTVRVS